jgi:uncharacterized protein involved in exopolysaccharide biosynthesis
MDEPVKAYVKTDDKASPVDELNLLDYALVLAGEKRLILSATLASFLLACFIVLLLPATYTATARILPPDDVNGLTTMLAGGSELAALVGISAGRSSADLHVGMLKSRTVADRIIDRFELLKVYGVSSRAIAQEKLASRVDISAGRIDQIVAINVDDRDSQRSAAIANGFVEELRSLSVRLNLGSASRERQFLEERLASVKLELQRTEEDLRKFQEENKAIQLDEQAKSIIGTIARLKGELASREVELRVLLTAQTERTPQVRGMREGIAQVREQLRLLEHSPAGETVGDDIYIATSKVPDISMRYARLLRDFNVQETLYEFLTQQYEGARVSEARSTSAIQVLDQAVPPDKKSKPRRTLIVLLVTCTTSFLVILFVLLREWSREMSAEDRARLKKINEVFFGRQNRHP